MVGSPDIRDLLETLPRPPLGPQSRFQPPLRATRRLDLYLFFVTLEVTPILADAPQLQGHEDSPDLASLQAKQRFA